MIDTIKFKIRVNEETFARLKCRAKELTKYDHQEDRVIFNFAECSTEVGSYDRRVTIKLFSAREVYVEFSVPKFVFGHNIYLLYPEEVEKALVDFRGDLANRGYVLPDINQWEVVRLDVCYAWKYLDDSVARTVMRQLQQLEQPRKKRVVWQDESVMFKGTSYSTKFYLKKPEYYFHDFKHLKKVDVDLAYRLLNNSQGVLRFEVTMRMKALKHYFGHRVHVKHLSHDIIEELLQKFISKAMRGLVGESKSSEEAIELLNLFYKPSKARALWMFWKLYFDKDLRSRSLLKKAYSRNAIWYNLKQLSNIGIGIPKEELETDFDFSIPSNIVVNEAPARKRGRRAGSVTPAKCSTH